MAFMPSSDACTLLVRMMQPSGVHGASAANPPANRPALLGCSPSTSLAGSTALMIVSVCSDFGSGSCTRMPWTLGSRLSFPISASKSLCATSAGSTCSHLAFGHAKRFREQLRHRAIGFTGLGDGAHPHLDHGPAIGKRL